MLASPSRYAGDDKYDPEEVALMKVCLTVSHGRIPMHNTLAFGRDALAGSRRFPNPPPPRLTPPRNRIASALSTTSLAATSSPLPAPSHHLSTLPPPLRPRPHRPRPHRPRPLTPSLAPSLALRLAPSLAPTALAPTALA
jgi:hypothetical protein